MNASQMSVVLNNSVLRDKVDEYLKEVLKGCGYSELLPSYGAFLSIVYRNGGKVQLESIYNDLDQPEDVIAEGINGLVELGYLKKDKQQQNDTCTFIETTDKAVEFSKNFRRISEALKDKIFDGFAPDEQERFVALLEKAAGNLAGIK